MTSWGVAAYEKKGEDAFVADGHCFGVFDGHGGASSAAATAQELPTALRKVMSEEEAACDESLVGAFYDVDASVGPKFFSQGSTATCALLDWRSPELATVVLAWVGDSVAAEVDMETRKLVFESSPHHVSNSTDMRRIEAQLKLRDDAAAEPPEEFKFVLSRSQDYEARLNESLSSNTSMYKRRQTTVTRREIDAHKGPVVLQSWLEGKQGELVRGASTQVTRSIGDWDSSRALLPHPDIIRRRYTKGWRRFIIASDGLWDVLSPRRSARIVVKISDPRAAADALLLSAKKAYSKQGWTSCRDDTTIIVFDVKLSEEPTVSTRPRHTIMSLLSFNNRFCGSMTQTQRSVAAQNQPSDREEADNDDNKGDVASSAELRRGEATTTARLPCSLDQKRGFWSRFLQGCAGGSGDVVPGDMVTKT